VIEHLGARPESDRRLAALLGQRREGELD
jgi:hypothetical protein